MTLHPAEAKCFRNRGRWCPLSLLRSWGLLFCFRSPPLPTWCPACLPLHCPKSPQHPQEGWGCSAGPQALLASASRTPSICFSLFPLPTVHLAPAHSPWTHSFSARTPSLPLSLKEQVCRRQNKCLAHPRLCVLSCINSYSHKGVLFCCIQQRLSLIKDLLFSRKTKDRDMNLQNKFFPWSKNLLFYKHVDADAVSEWNVRSVNWIRPWWSKLWGALQDCVYEVTNSITQV